MTAVLPTPSPSHPPRSEPVQIDPADSGHQDAPPDQPEPVREPDRADHRRPGYVRCPMLGCGRLHELPPDFW